MDGKPVTHLTPEFHEIPQRKVQFWGVDVEEIRIRGLSASNFAASERSLWRMIGREPRCMATGWEHEQGQMLASKAVLDSNSIDCEHVESS